VTARTFVLVLLFSSVAHAEVMDKEPTLGAIWLWCAATVVLGGLAYWYSLPLGVLVSTPGTLFVIGMEQELADRWVGPAIVAEAGASYPIHVHVVLMIVVGVHAFGIHRAHRRRVALPRRA
jgi:hypothetical protein